MNITSYLVRDKNVCFATYFSKYIHFTFFAVIFIFLCVECDILTTTMDLAGQFLL